MHKQSSTLQMTLVAGRRAGVVQVSHRVLKDQPMWFFASGLCCYAAARLKPSTACAEEAHASVVGSAIEAPRCSR